ncbi:MAG: ABC transporter ATP-binding protein [Clostridiaceae bacterium]|jgi:ATP-binding cassette subfamily B protein|nr:ABC transporter ATP-binding protein/permease [Clostridiales bacterium]MDD4186516.1 ABC transporter ATP-binding protein [Eubacteriales bacterium]MDY0119288.1 ABC transporter ATP-binding protein [Clostridia bacterium]NLG29870.1 ABC transporter ATP-binding protein [Clostridiaceae bacterium]
MIKILKYMRRRDWVLTFIAIFFTILRVYFELKIPEYMKQVTELVMTEGATLNSILTTGQGMLLAALGNFLVMIVVVVLSARVGACFATRLRILQFDRVSSFSMEEINRFSTASLITRSTNDVTQVQFYLAMVIRIMIPAPITAVWAITKITAQGAFEWSVAMTVAVVVLLIFITIIFKFAMPRFKRLQSLTDNINRITREHLLGIRVVKAYNAEGYQESKFEDANEELTHTNLTAHRIMMIQGPGMGLVMNGLSIAIYWIGAILIDRAGAGEKIALFSSMVIFMNYAMQIVMSFMRLSMLFAMAPRVAVSANRIREVVETEPTVQDGSFDTSDVSGDYAIEFKNVSFRYPDGADDILRDISFKVKAGETIAFIGATGSGKSTLLNLIPRFYDATEGEVLIDGMNVKDYHQKALRQKFGYVPQTAFLFSGTIADNIDYGDTEGIVGSLASLDEAAAVGQIKSYVDTLPEGYEAPVARGGTNFSGGQKQRISIARAIHRKAPIYLFDDAFSALDYNTDRALRHALKEKMKGATSLIVAQRIGTIRDADQILVLDEGRVVGMGTHAELMEHCRVYQEIALSQLSMEELVS